MLHLCVRHKEGYEIEVLVNEYTQHIASWLIGSYLTKEKRDQNVLRWLADAALLEYGEYEYRDIEKAQRMLFVLPMSAPLGLPEVLGLFDTLSSKDVHPTELRHTDEKEVLHGVSKDIEKVIQASELPTHLKMSMSEVLHGLNFALGCGGRGFGKGRDFSDRHHQD